MTLKSPLLLALALNIAHSATKDFAEIAGCGAGRASIAPEAAAPRFKLKYPPVLSSSCDEHLSSAPPEYRAVSATAKTNWDDSRLNVIKHHLIAITDGAEGVITPKEMAIYEKTIERLSDEDGLMKFSQEFSKHCVVIGDRILSQFDTTSLTEKILYFSFQAVSYFGACNMQNATAFLIDLRQIILIDSANEAEKMVASRYLKNFTSSITVLLTWYAPDSEISDDLATVDYKNERSLLEIHIEKFNGAIKNHFYDRMFKNEYLERLQSSNPLLYGHSVYVIAQAHIEKFFNLGNFFDKYNLYGSNRYQASSVLMDLKHRYDILLPLMATKRQQNTNFDDIVAFVKKMSPVFSDRIAHIDTTNAEGYLKIQNDFNRDNAIWVADIDNITRLIQLIAPEDKIAEFRSLFSEILKQAKDLSQLKFFFERSGEAMSSDQMLPSLRETILFTEKLLESNRGYYLQESLEKLFGYREKGQEWYTIAARAMLTLINFEDRQIKDTHEKVKLSLRRLITPKLLETHKVNSPISSAVSLFINSLNTADPLRSILITFEDNGAKSIPKSILQDLEGAILSLPSDSYDAIVLEFLEKAKLMAV
jgi:hypothetical protein